jgi:hypothetical protein
MNFIPLPSEMVVFFFTTFTGASALKYERAYVLKYERVKAKEVKIPSKQSLDIRT